MRKEVRKKEFRRKEVEFSLETSAPKRSIQSFRNTNFSGDSDKKHRNGSQNSMASL